ncbi:hypothetical protein GCM10010260_02770 [Streptomyces filipinensis]|uniref:Secreted protein n=1 Tax=Streptomyces filipinensis TaxID=66887 RepID=A0A918M8W7_9ACTN|nr:hypothetical protein [Streptomyces filipinensis]GGU74386.1 hypothetical protein GCM10010260_02770 [Streptomyces filipinensis]
MKKAVFTTAALAIGASLVGGSAVAASAAGKAPASETGPLGLMSQTEVTPALVPAADTVMRVAKQGNLTKGSAFDTNQASTVTGKNKAAKISGVYLDGMGRSTNKKPAIPVKNPLGTGSVQVHPLNGPTSAGLGSLLNQG